MTRTRIAAVAVVIAAVIVAVIAWKGSHDEKPAEEVGFVLAIDGQWVDEASHPLALGQATKGGKITRKSEKGELTIALLDDTSKTCAGECRSIELPQTLAKTRAAPARIIAAVKPLFADRPERFASAMSRGGALDDAVAKLDAGSVDLAPALARVPAGTIAVTLTSRAKPEDVFENSVVWAPGGPARIAEAELAPGLYTLSAQNESAWILVTAPGDFERASTAWRQAGAVAGLPDDAKRILQRAWLESLAAPGAT